MRQFVHLLFTSFANIWFVSLLETRYNAIKKVMNMSKQRKTGKIILLILAALLLLLLAAIGIVDPLVQAQMRFHLFATSFL